MNERANEHKFSVHSQLYLYAPVSLYRIMGSTLRKLNSIFSPKMSTFEKLWDHDMHLN